MNNVKINSSIIESIGMPILFRNEFSFMINPLENLLKYSFIFLFYLIPILIVFHLIDCFTIQKIYLNILVILPLFLLFYIGRDWGRWIHIILFVIFCFNIYLINNESLKAEMAEKGYQRVLEALNWRRAAESVTETYENTIKDFQK